MVEDEQIDQFRKALNKYKAEHFFEKLNNETDEQSIARRIQEAEAIFEILLNYIQDPENNKIDDKDLEELIGYLGSPEEWSVSLPTKVQSILMSDLLDYPLTFNSQLIRQFKELQETQTFPTFT